VIEIEKAEFFRALRPEQLARVTPLLREKAFERQRVIYFEGAPAERLWVVRQGEVRLYKSSPSGQITTLDVLGPGEVFGAISAIEQDAYSASAETVTDGSVCWLGRDVFLRLLNEDPQLTREILQIVTRRLRDAHDRLRSLAHDPAPTRVALALLRAANGSEARVTRRALAEAAGTSVETAIRVVRRFEVAGIVQGNVGRVKILDGAALERIAHSATE
jgi:CRP-like cAMP-binding protein